MTQPVILWFIRLCQDEPPVQGIFNLAEKWKVRQYDEKRLLVRICFYDKLEKGEFDGTYESRTIPV